MSIPTSLSMGQLAGASTIAEEGGEAAGGGGEGMVGAESHHSSNSNGLPLPVSTTGGQRQAPVQQQLTDIRVDTSSYHGSGGGGGGGGGPPLGQISPASDYRRGSMSPGLPVEER